MSFATPRGRRGNVRIGHFGYGHIDPVVSTGELVAPGQHIGWTWEGGWHVHLSEFVLTTGASIVVNPLRPGGKLHPFVDRAAPEIREIRFHAPATPDWARRPNTSVARLPHEGERLNRDRLFGLVDVRVRVSDPQTFIGWFQELPWLAAPHHPFRLAVTIRHRQSGRAVRRREVFRAEQMLGLAAGRHLPPAPSRTCRRTAAWRSTARCAATAFTGSGSSRFATGTRRSSRTAVTAWSCVPGTWQETSATADAEVTIANGV